MARSGLIFDPATGLNAPETSEIRDGVAQDWAQAFYDPDLPPLDTDSVTPAGQLIDAEVAEIEAKNAEILHLSSMTNPKTAEGRWQDALGHIYFLERKLDEPTVVTCQVTGLNGTVIPYGALVQSLNGHTLVCNRSAAISSNGMAETTFRVSETGPVDIPAHSVTSIVTTIPGWDTVDNAAAGAVGRDIETRSEFEARRAASVAANAHGSVGALFGTIANIPGVLDVQVLENRGPDPVVTFGVTVPGHGVAICVYGGEDKDIAKAIYSKIDNGADTGGNTDVVHIAEDFRNIEYAYKIMRPDTVNFWIRVVLGPGGSITPEAVVSLKQSLYRDFYGMNESSANPRIGLASTVYASRFYAAAMAVPGVKNIKEIQIALSETEPDAEDFADVITIKGDQEPVLSTENIAVTASHRSASVPGA